MYVILCKMTQSRYYSKTGCDGMNMYCKKKTMIEVEGARSTGRPKKTWREIVDKDCQACGLNREDAMDHIRWKKQIRDD